MLRIFSVLADIDRILTVERLRIGREIYRQEGGHVGRSYTSVPEKIQKQIIELYEEKKIGMINIAKVVSPFEIYDQKKKQKEMVTIGKKVVNRILVENNIPIRSRGRSK